MLQAVTGPVDPADLDGAVLAHEHLVLSLERPGGDRARLGDEPTIAAELRALRESGRLSGLIELTNRGMGRDPLTMRRLAVEAGVTVIAATGFYWEPFHPPEVASRDVDDLAELLVQDVRTGMDGTDVRAGLLGEIGSHGQTPSPAEAVCLRASARAATRTDVSLVTHAELGIGGLAQLDLLCGEEGLAPSRVCVGHQDLHSDRDTHRRIAELGAYVGFDTIGKSSFQPDEERVACVVALVEEGYADRVLLSNDVSRDSYLQRPGGGYGFLFTSFLPRLLQAGLDAATVRLMTHDNPIRFLTGA